MHKCEQILSLLNTKYPSIIFLEGFNNAVRRFEKKQIILFRYFFGNYSYVIKYYSLEHLDGEMARKERTAVYDEFNLAKEFEGHPGVINVYECDILEQGGSVLGVFYIMDFFELTLDKILSGGRKFNDEEVLSFLKQMGSALAHAHLKAGIVHSDIKPANIGVEVVNDEYFYKLMDFDVSVRIQKEPSSGKDLIFTISDKVIIRGMTPAYAAPEQILAQINPDTIITGKVDTYAVGVIAVQMLTGKAPKSNPDSLFYNVPLKLLTSRWYNILSLVCNPDIKHRPRKITDLLGEKKPLIRIPDFINYFAPFFQDLNFSWLKRASVFTLLILLFGFMLMGLLIINAGKGNDEIIVNDNGNNDTIEKPCETPGKPINLSASATDQTSASLSWNQGNPPGSDYIAYSWELMNIRTDATAASGTTTETSTSATGLRAGTTYKFRVMASTSCNNTSSGWSDYSTNFSTQSPPRPTVPNLVGRTQGVATRNLRNQGFTNVRILREVSGPDNHGMVIAITPTPGTTLSRRNQQITLTIGVPLEN